MTLERSLQNVQDDIDSGDLGKARDRLHGLIGTYTINLELRPMLAEIYWQLQQPAMAGRYWYLEENKTEQMEKACACFEKSFNHDAYSMLCAINFKGNFERIKDTYAGKRILELNAQTKDGKNWFEKKYLPRFSKPVDTRVVKKPTFSQRVRRIILILAVALFIICSCIGAFSIIYYLSHHG